jgi:hypothetical protein
VGTHIEVFVGIDTAKKKKKHAFAVADTGAQRPTRSLVERGRFNRTRRCRGRCTSVSATRQVGAYNRINTFGKEIRPRIRQVRAIPSDNILGGIAS